LKASVLAICGPTASGKTGVAIELARILRERGVEPVAVSCDAMQVYRGLAILTNQPTESDKAILEHRLAGFVDPAEEFSAGRYAELAHREIDAAIEAGWLPMVIGGTGLYMRAALCDLELRPPVPVPIRAQVEEEIAQTGTESVHAGLPEEVRARIHPRDRKRVARTAELLRAGIEPSSDSEGLWAEGTRHPTAIFGLTIDRDELALRIEERTAAMIDAGVEAEVLAVDRAGASRTVRTAHGYRELLEGRIEDWKRAQRDYARRQMTWLRKTPGLVLIDRTGLSDAEAASEIAARLNP
jgi:tRNA dimethylallyltransferase